MSDTSSQIPSSVVAPPPRQTSADDLLSMYDEEVATKEAEINDEVEKQAEVAERLPKKIVTKALEKKINEREETEALPSDNSLDNKEKEGEESQESEKPELTFKSIKAKHGDSDLDIPEEAQVTLNINGKDVSVKVKDALDVYQGLESRTRKLDQKTSWVDNREKKLQAEYKTVQDRFQVVSELAAQGDHVLAIRTLAEMAGKDPVEYEKSVLETLHKVVETFSNMTDEQKRAYFAERKNEFLQKKLEETKTKTTYDQKLQELQFKVDSFSKELGLSKDDFFSFYKELAEANVFPSAEEIQPEQVVEYVQAIRHVKKVDSAIKQVNPELLKDERFVDWIIQSTKDEADWSASDIAKIVKDALGPDSASIESLNRKVQKANSTGHRAQSTQVSSKKENSEVDDELYSFFIKPRPTAQRVQR